MTTDLTVHDRHRLLNQLANRLDDLPHDKFHIPFWCGNNATEVDCGTAGCVGGWAVTWHHKELGLRLDFYELCGSRDRYLHLPSLDLWSSEAFAHAYGLSNEDASWITASGSWAGGPDGCSYYHDEFNLKSNRDVTPRMAAKRIRDVLKRVAPELLVETPVKAREVVTL